MKQRELASFTVRIFSADNATWQGEVTSGGEVFAFRSEMQMLKWLFRKYPRLMPEVGTEPHMDNGRELQ